MEKRGWDNPTEGLTVVCGVVVTHLHPTASRWRTRQRCLTAVGCSAARGAGDGAGAAPGVCAGAAAAGTAPKPPGGESSGSGSNRPVNKTLAREMGFTWWVLHSSCVIPSSEAHSRSWRGGGSCTDKTQNRFAFYFHLCFSGIKICSAHV